MILKLNYWQDFQVWLRMEGSKSVYGLDNTDKSDHFSVVEIDQRQTTMCKATMCKPVGLWSRLRWGDCAAGRGRDVRSRGRCRVSSEDKRVDRASGCASLSCWPGWGQACSQLRLGTHMLRRERAGYAVSPGQPQTSVPERARNEADLGQT